MCRVNLFFLFIGIEIRWITRIACTTFIGFIPINLFSAKNRPGVRIVTWECLTPEYSLVFCLTASESIRHIAWANLSFCYRLGRILFIRKLRRAKSGIYVLCLQIEWIQNLTITTTIWTIASNGIYIITGNISAVEAVLYGYGVTTISHNTTRAISRYSAGIDTVDNLDVYTLCYYTACIIDCSNCTAIFAVCYHTIVFNVSNNTARIISDDITVIHTITQFCGTFFDAFRATDNTSCITAIICIICYHRIVYAVCNRAIAFTGNSTRIARIVCFHAALYGKVFHNCTAVQRSEQSIILIITWIITHGKCYGMTITVEYTAITATSTDWRAIVALNISRELNIDAVITGFNGFLYLQKVIKRAYQVTSVLVLL